MATRRVWTLTTTMTAAAVLAAGLGTAATATAADHPARDAAAAREAAERTKSVLYRAAATGKARTFLTAIYVAGLTDTLRNDGPFTLFVPTDQAFANLPDKAILDLLQPENQKALTDLLKYHVIPGRVTSDAFSKDPTPKTVLGPTLTIAENRRGVGVNDATLVAKDVLGRNGVVHFIDRVLTPPTGGILDVAEKAGQFKILAKAIEAAGLADALRDGDNLTVLAPTDDAFRRLGDDAIKGLLKDPKALAEVLKFHVIPARLDGDALVAGGPKKTLQGGSVDVKVKRGRLTVAEGGATVVDTDVAAENGIIHVIDRVLMPPAGHH